MTPSEILTAISQSGPMREAGAYALLATLRQWSRQPLRESRRRTSYRIPDSHQDEVVGAVVSRVVVGPTLPVVGKSDGECERYLQTMLVNKFLSIVRRDRRLVALEPDDSLADTTRPPDDESQVPSETALRAKQLLATVADATIASVQPRYRNDLAIAWKQIQELVYEEQDLRSMILRDAPRVSTDTPADFTRERNRVLKNHSRFRERMLEQTTALVNSGTLTAEEGQHTTAAINKFLTRCQRTDP